MNTITKICFAGGEKAGMIAFLALEALPWIEIKACATKDEDLHKIMTLYDYYPCPSINSPVFRQYQKETVLVNVHGREIIPYETKGINVHPYLYMYKGADPIGKAIKDKNKNGSVGVHLTTEHIDCGEVLWETFVSLKDMTNRDTVYNQLYPAYVEALIMALWDYRKEDL